MGATSLWWTLVLPAALAARILTPHSLPGAPLTRMIPTSSFHKRGAMAVEGPRQPHLCAPRAGEWTCVVLGDLHLDENDMSAHYEARDQIKDILKTLPGSPGNTRLVSLGDLGAYGSAGTTSNFEFSKKFLEGFGMPFNIITGNHDLEGMTEFTTDKENFAAWKKAFDVSSPHGTFSQQIAEKTLLVGLSTEQFRDNKFSSHEVFISDPQLEWFASVLKAHPAEEGWNIVTFSHAPPMGSQLRHLNSVHVKNTCAWLNHAQGTTRRRTFYRLAREHGGVSVWCSGHFHLSHDYEDSMGIVRGHHPGSMTAYATTGVIGHKSCRDGRRQSRIIHGDAETIRIFSVNHHETVSNGVHVEPLRLDLSFPSSLAARARLSALGEFPKRVPLPEGEKISEGDEWWFSARTPQQGDGCYLPTSEGSLDIVDQSTPGAVCWWHMKNGAVVGVHDGLLVEYDDETLAPVGLVAAKDDVKDRRVEVAEDGVTLILRSESNPEGTLEILPRDDGSYHRVFQENKWIRFLREQSRAKSADAAAATSKN